MKNNKAKPTAVWLRGWLAQDSRGGVSMLSRMTAVFVVAAASLAAQTYDFSGAAKTIPFRVLSGEPGVCSPGEAYYNLTTTHLRYCGIVNTWADMAANSGAVTSSTLTANTIPKASGASALANSAVADDGTNVTITGRSLGVGMTPTAAFEVAGSNSLSTPIARISPGTGASTDTGILAFNGRASFGYDGARAAVYIGDLGSSKPIVFDSGALSAEKMRLSTAGGLSLGATTDPGAGNLLLNGSKSQIKTVLTVSGLSTCNAGAEGTWSAVSDATAPTYNAALTGGGAVHVPVYCDGTSWKSH